MRSLGYITAMLALAASATTSPPVQEYRISRREQAPEVIRCSTDDRLDRDPWRTRNRPNRKARR